MDFEGVKRSLEAAAAVILPTPALDNLPSKFYDAFILHGIHVDLIEPGRILCSMAVPPRLLNTGRFLHGGATMSLVDLVGSAALCTVGARTSGYPLEMNTSYLDSAFVHEEIEIEAKVLRAGKSIGVLSIDIRKKTGKLIAQARYTKYLVSTKM
ncbi:hypothetical protein AXF42_Ash019542 [Apostasia shenzhenica]|uniref:Thioesterase domain-containing protein n=1 Tax=Apostasia shenzhenica TaxID=1088818 RepID=A0A2I0A0F1_9ASPA|nr:hypothetical protein AXF42_Ash019542 [Apostasia shenzhenica]